jgi:hypothetical protein
VVGVYDGTSVSIYLNGALVGAPISAPGQIVPSGNHLQIGHDPANTSRYFNGLIDEASVYSAALSAAQVQALYNAGSAGKCGLPPTISVQPQSQTGNVGSHASFAVAANGTPPFSYQWQFNGRGLAGASNSTLTLTNIQVTDGGSYTVLVTNAYGSAASSNAVLAVVPPPPCSPPPAGLVSWWQGEGNANDATGGNNGTLQGGASFVAGMVGQAFSFDPASGTVIVPDSSSLRLTNQLTIEAWINTQGQSTDYGIVSKVGGTG